MSLCLSIFLLSSLIILLLFNKVGLIDHDLIADVACYLILRCVFTLCSVMCSAASSGGGSASVSPGAAGGPAEGSAAGAEGGGAGGEKLSHGGRARAPAQTHGGKCLGNFNFGNF